MTQNLTSEQVNYLKSLDSKKKRRKFILDCLVDSVIGESVKFDLSKISDLPSNKEMSINEAIEHIKNTPFQFSSTTAPRTFQGIFGRMSNIKEEKDGSITFELPSYNETKDEFDKKRDELLKFDLSKEQMEINLICEVQDYLNSINIFIEANQIKKLKKIFFKYHESANSEKKYTEEDMRKCFFKSLPIFCEKSQVTTEDFDKYIKSLKND